MQIYYKGEVHQIEEGLVEYYRHTIIVKFGGIRKVFVRNDGHFLNRLTYSTKGYNQGPIFGMMGVAEFMMPKVFTYENEILIYADHPFDVPVLEEVFKICHLS